MDSPSNSSRTRCGQPIGEPKKARIYSWPYGSDKTTCKTCNRLHAADLVKNSKRIEYKCIRTDCGGSGCTSSSINNDPPEFCIYDFDEAYWVEVKGGDDS